MGTFRDTVYYCCSTNMKCISVDISDFMGTTSRRRDRHTFDGLLLSLILRIYLTPTIYHLDTLITEGAYECVPARGATTQGLGGLDSQNWGGPAMFYVAF